MTLEVVELDALCPEADIGVPELVGVRLRFGGGGLESCVRGAS